METTDNPGEPAPVNSPDSSYTTSQNGDSASQQQQTAGAGDTASTHVKKRGRPRKTKSDGEGVSTQGDAFKRPRGRPPGSKNKVLKTGPPLIPMVLTISPGEDVVEKLKETCRVYKRSLIILAAAGTLSIATLMQVEVGGHGVGVELKGHFSLLSMSGAIIQGNSEPEMGKLRDSTEFMSVSLANPKGGVVGGTVAGVLEASSPITVVVGQWDNERSREEGDERVPKPLLLTSGQMSAQIAEAVYQQP